MRVPHKPLLLLWLFGQFAATGSSTASYQQAEEPVSQLINEFGPPVASPAGAHRSVIELEDDIRKWINEWNKDPRPFIWTKSADDILETVAEYCQRITDSGH